MALLSYENEMDKIMGSNLMECMYLPIKKYFIYFTYKKKKKK
jgi:hypothetical protein